MKASIFGLGLGLVLSLGGCLDPSDAGGASQSRTARDAAGAGRSRLADKGASPANAGSDRVPRSKEGSGKGSYRH